MRKDFALLIAGIIFGLIALLQLVRLVRQFEVMINGQMIPLWASGVAFIVALILSFWMFKARRS